MAPTRSRPDVAAAIVEEDFKVNGCATLRTNDADHYLSCAHAVLVVFQNSVSYAESCRCSEQIEATALSAVQTLIELGMWQLQHDRKAA